MPIRCPAAKSFDNPVVARHSERRSPVGGAVAWRFCPTPGFPVPTTSRTIPNQSSNATNRPFDRRFSASQPLSSVRPSPMTARHKCMNSEGFWWDVVGICGLGLTKGVPRYRRTAYTILYDLARSQILRETWIERGARPQVDATRVSPMQKRVHKSHKRMRQESISRPAPSSNTFTSWILSGSDIQGAAQSMQPWGRTLPQERGFVEWKSPGKA